MAFIRPNTASKTVWVLTWLVICSPIWIYLADFTSFGRLQNNDYYPILLELTDGDSLTSDPWRWLNLKSNEHRTTLPVLFYALNIALTDGHNLGLTFFSLLLLTIVLVLLVRQLDPEIRSSPWAKAVFGFVLALFCYTPLAAHNVAMGFSGSIWFFANALAVAAVGVLAKRAGEGDWWSLWPVLLFGLAAAFSHSTHLVLWPTLIAGGLFLRLGWRGLIALGSGMAVVVTLFALSYEPLPYHPEMNTRNPWSLLRYAAAYLGSLFHGDLETAKLLGGIGIVASILSCGLAVFFLRSAERRTELAPWLMLQLYGGGNALVSAIGRSGFGENQALSSRYASLSALFWIGLLTPLGIVVWRWRPAKRGARIAALLAVAGLAAAAGAAMQARGRPVVERFVHRGSRQCVAEMAMVQKIPDEEVIRKAVAPWPIHVLNLRPYLKASGHVPFDRDLVLRLGEVVDPALLSEGRIEGVRAFFDNIEGLPGGVARVAGWAYGPDTEIAEVLVLDRQGAICGKVCVGQPRRDVAQAVHPDAIDSGWMGYAVVGDDPLGLRAYVRLAGDDTFHRMQRVGRASPPKPD
ncbi:MAG: hypothetical protein GY719_30780 [bacterium]|nr:hypothetical protein [bacterium]